MLEFMSNEVFQIIVIIAFVFIGIEIYYFCRYSFKIPSVSEKSDISTDKIYEIVDDVDYRLDRINSKVNELMNMFMNGLIVNDEKDEQNMKEANDERDEQEANDEQDVKESHDERDEQESHDKQDDNTIMVAESTVAEERNTQLNASENVIMQQDYKDIIFDDNESLNNGNEEKTNIEQRIISSIKNHIKEINYEGLEISDLPKTEDLQSDDGNGTSIDLSVDAVVYEPDNVEPVKKLKVAKRLLN